MVRYLQPTVTFDVHDPVLYKHLIAGAGPTDLVTINGNTLTLMAYSLQLSAHDRQVYYELIKDQLDLSDPDVKRYQLELGVDFDQLVKQGIPLTHTQFNDYNYALASTQFPRGLSDQAITQSGDKRGIPYGLGLGYLCNMRQYHLEIAQRGFHWDHLLASEDNSTREFLARQLYRLDYLKRDSSPTVRAAVASQGYALDTLAFDDDARVRDQVAKQGLFIRHFKYDTHPIIQDTIRHMDARQFLL